MTKEAKPSMKAAVLSKCHDCMGHYADRDRDCGNSACSLYSWQPYKKSTPNLEWVKYSPKRSGLVLKTDAARVFTPEQRQAAAERLSAARARRAAGEEVPEEELNADTDIEDEDEDAD